VKLARESTVMSSDGEAREKCAKSSLRLSGMLIVSMHAAGTAGAPISNGREVGPALVNVKLEMLIALLPQPTIVKSTRTELPLCGRTETERLNGIACKVYIVDGRADRVTTALASTLMESGEGTLKCALSSANVVGMLKLKVHVVGAVGAVNCSGIIAALLNNMSVSLIAPQPATLSSNVTLLCGDCVGVRASTTCSFV
jgi:hypothetical protein